MESRAKLELLFLGQFDEALNLNESNLHPQDHLQEIEEPIKSRTVKLKQSKIKILKLKTESESNSLEKIVLKCAKNKENLKKILRKLEDSPSPKRKQGNKLKKNNFKFKTIETEHHRENIQFKQSKSNNHQLNLFDYAYLMKEDDHIKGLIKNKIVQKVRRNVELRKKESLGLKQASAQRKTLKQLSKPGKASISSRLSKDKENFSLSTLRGKDPGFVFSRRNSRVTLNNLLF